MSNHMARTWDHKKNKHLDPKFLLLNHYLDDFLLRLLKQVVLSLLLLRSPFFFFFFFFFFPCEYYLLPFFSSHSICYSDIFLSFFFFLIYGPCGYLRLFVCRLVHALCPPLLCIIMGFIFYFLFCLFKAFRFKFPSLIRVEIFSLILK
jgi:hypothetical protein